jgi:hypothetical protein
MERKPGHCGVCGAPLRSKAIARPASPDVTTHTYCPSEKDDQHEKAADRGWDPYRAEIAPVS